MPNVILALGSLAWRRCSRDIEAVARMWIGGAVAGIFFIVMFSVISNNYVIVLPKGVLTPEMLNVLFDIQRAVHYSLVFGLEYTAILLTIVAVIVCILEYTGNFLYVLYYYDNCSWKSVQFVRNVFVSIDNVFIRAHEINRSESRKQQMQLMVEILKIKNSSKDL